MFFWKGLFGTFSRHLVHFKPNENSCISKRYGVVLVVGSYLAVANKMNIYVGLISPAVESAAALQAEVNVLRGNLKGGETFPLPLAVPGDTVILMAFARV